MANIRLSKLPAVEEKSDWVSLAPTGQAGSSSSSSATPSYHLTHVNSSLIQGARGQKGKRRGKKSNQSMSCGNDQRIPWVPRPLTRSVEINTVETLPVSLFITSSTIAAVQAAANFVISSVNDIASFSAVFDQYRISMVEVLIEPQITEAVTAAGDPGAYVSAVDIDDSNVTAYNDLCSYTTAVQSRGTSSHYHRFVPGVAVAVYSGAFTSFASTDSMWLDLGSTAIQHYGVKISANATAAPQIYSLNVRLHCMWRARH